MKVNYTYSNKVTGLGSIYNPQWGITFKVYFKNIAINELYQLTDGTVHVETEGAQAYIDSFVEELDAQDSIPANDDEPIDTDTDINIPQDTITIDGVIDSVFVNPTTGDIIVVTDTGEEITIDEEDLESEDGSVLLTDSQGNSWTVDKDGNVSGGGGTGGSGTGTNTNTQLALKIELIKEALTYYKTEVTQWLDNYEKGPLSPAILQRMQELPACLPQDAEALQQVLVKIDNYLQAPESLLALLNENVTDKTLLEATLQVLNGKMPPYKEVLTTTQWNQLVDMLCPYVTVAAIPSAKIWYNNNLYENTVSTNDNIILELEPSTTFMQTLQASYGTRTITVSLAWEYPEYEFKELYAKHGASRIAKSGEILYLVDPPSATDTKKIITYSIETNPNEVDKNKITDITWYKNDTKIGSILKFDTKNITRTITEDDNTTTLVKAGYPTAKTKSLEVKWVDGDIVGFSFMPPAISAIVTKTFEEVNGSLKTIDKYIGDTKFKVDAIKIGGTKQNLEDNSSRLYYTKEVGYVSGGLTANMAEIEITHPILKGLSRMGVAKIGLFAQLDIKIALKGGVERYKYIEEDDYRNNNPFIQFTTGGCIEGGIQAELLVAKQYVNFKLKGAATACVVGRLKYEFETEKFTGDIYIPPVIIAGEIKISSKGYLEFDLINWTGNISVTEQIDIYHYD